MAVVVAGPTPIDSQPFQTLIATLADAAGREPYIEEVASYLTTADSTFVSSDRHATFLLASVVAEHADMVTRAVPAFRAAIRTRLRIRGGRSTRSRSQVNPPWTGTLEP